MDDFVAQFLNRLKMQHYRGFDPIGYAKQVGSNFKSPQNLSPGFTHHFKMLTTKQYLLRSTQHPQGDFNVCIYPGPWYWPKIGAMILLLTLCKRKLKCCIRILGYFIITLMKIFLMIPTSQQLVTHFLDFPLWENRIAYFK